MCAYLPREQCRRLEAAGSEASTGVHLLRALNTLEVMPAAPPAPATRKRVSKPPGKQRTRGASLSSKEGHASGSYVAPSAGASRASDDDQPALATSDTFDPVNPLLDWTV
jgi:hypothetical protein